MSIRLQDSKTTTAKNVKTAFLTTYRGNQNKPEVTSSPFLCVYLNRLQIIKAYSMLKIFKRYKMSKPTAFDLYRLWISQIWSNLHPRGGIANCRMMLKKSRFVLVQNLVVGEPTSRPKQHLVLQQQRRALRSRNIAPVIVACFFLIFRHCQIEVRPRSKKNKWFNIEVKQKAGISIIEGKRGLVKVYVPRRDYDPSKPGLIMWTSCVCMYIYVYVYECGGSVRSLQLVEGVWEGDWFLLLNIFKVISF